MGKLNIKASDRMTISENEVSDSILKNRTDVLANDIRQVMVNKDFENLGFINKFHVYSNIRNYRGEKVQETIVEVWGASTKHCDLYKQVEHDNYLGVFPIADMAQTILKMGSETLFSFHIQQYIDFANYVMQFIKE